MQSETPNSRILITTVWAALLLGGMPIASPPKIILQEVFDYQVSSDLEYGIAVAVGILGLGLTFAWSTVRALRPFFVVLLAFTVATWLAWVQIGGSPIFEGWLASPSPNVALLAFLSRNFMVALAMLPALFILKKKREAIFLVTGDTSAPLEPVRWLGIKAGATWKKAGWASIIVISLGLLTFLVVAGGPSLQVISRALLFLPAIFLAAAMNAFGEEMAVRASFLSVMEDVVGKQQTLWLTAAAMGFGHFYGIPYGVTGVLMAGFLGWWLGKSILETRGLGWAWFIHFVQDVWISAFAVVGSVAPGGG